MSVSLQKNRAFVSILYTLQVNIKVQIQFREIKIKMRTIRC